MVAVAVAITVAVAVAVAVAVVVTGNNHDTNHDGMNTRYLVLRWTTCVTVTNV